MKRLEADQLTPLVVQCWKNHVVHLVPDPAQAEKSDYTSHAQWLATLNELNAPAYRKLIDKWKEIQKRRKNLWNAVQEKNLP